MLLASVSVRTLTPCTALPSTVGCQPQPSTKTMLMPQGAFSSGPRGTPLS